MANGTTVLRGDAVIIPEELRRRFGLDDGSVLTVEADEEGIMLRPTDQPAVEIYAPERIAEFLLNNVMTAEDYRWALQEVRDMGLDPEAILHDKLTP